MDCDTWPVPQAGCYGGCTIAEGTDGDLLESASVRAGAILRTLSGGRVGTCTDSIRPLSECGRCGPVCSCGSGDRLRLFSWDGPITAVTQVSLDGSPIDGDTWRYFPSGQILYRVPPDVWPTKDHKTADCGDIGTMCVDVTLGYEPDAWALAVHAELTCELVQACTGGKCRLPRNATQVTGQGVSVTLSPTELKQFIPSVAGWVAAINPDSFRQVPRVFSPDLHGSQMGPGYGSSAGGGPGTIDGGGP